MSMKSTLYREIIRDYERQRDLNEAALRQRKSFIYHKIPEIEEIDQMLSLLGVKTARLALSKPDNIPELLDSLKKEQMALRQRRTFLLEKLGLSEEYLSIQYECTKCQDTGYIDGIPCTCLRQKFVDKAYDQSNIREIIKRENFDSFDMRYYSAEQKEEKSGISALENIQVNFKTCMDFVQSFGQKFDNLLLYGPTGLGKTFLCNCIAKELLDREKTVLYMTAPNLFKIIEDDRFHRKDGEEPSDYLEDILSVDLFIIDDLGTEFSTILSASELFHILNERLLARKPVIISTNLALSDLAGMYSDRVISRILGDYQMLKFFGEDIRVKKRSFNQ